MTKGGGSSTESPPFLFARYATPSNDIRREAGMENPPGKSGRAGRKEEKNSEQGYLAASSLLAVSLDSLFGMTQNLSNG